MKWIDAKEKSPNSNNELDIWTEQVIVNVLSPNGYNHVSTARMKGNEWYWNENNKKISEDFKVTHWMKLPKPLK